MHVTIRVRVKGVIGNRREGAKRKKGNNRMGETMKERQTVGTGCVGGCVGGRENLETDRMGSDSCERVRVRLCGGVVAGCLLARRSREGGETGER